MRRDDLAVARELLQTHGVDAAPEGLAEILAALPRASFSEREILCREGDASGCMWVLLQGSVQVIKRDYHGQPHPLAVVRAPGVLGHMGLVKGNPRSATCTAKTGLRVAVVDRARFEALMVQLSPAADAFRRLLISGMSSQLSAGNLALRTLLREAVPFER